MSVTDIKLHCKLALRHKLRSGLWSCVFAAKGGVVVDNRSSLHGLWFLDNPLSSSYSEGAGTGAHRRTPVSAACFTLNFHAGLGWGDQRHLVGGLPRSEVSLLSSLPCFIAMALQC